MADYNKHLQTNSTLIALLVCANPIAWVAKGGALPLICAFCLFGVILVNRKISFPTIILFTGLSFVFLISSTLKDNINNPYFDNYCRSIFTLGLTGFLCGQIDFDVKSVFRNIALFGVGFVAFVYRLDMGSTEDGTADYGNWMGVSYGILRIIDGLTIYGLFYSFKIKHKAIFLSVACAYLIFLFIYGSRGTLLAYASLLFFCWIINKGYGFKQFIKRLLIIAIPFVFIYYYFFDILLWLHSISQAVDIKLFFVEKLIALEEVGNISSGRSELIEAAIPGIINSPFIGNGIATYEPYNDGYVHNLFVQVFYELGIIPFILVCSIILLGLKSIVDLRIDKSHRLFIVYLISSGVVELLFSSTLWSSQVFWLYVGYVVQLCFNKKKYHVTSNFSTSIQ